MSPSTIELLPGETIVAELSVTASNNASPGDHGLSINVSDSNITNHVNSINATYTVITGCTPNIPDLTLSPPSQSGSADTTLSYSISITNTDEGGCEQSTFNLNPSFPLGWSGTVSPNLISLLPGETGTATFFATSANDAMEGNYNLTIDAADNLNSAHRATANAIYIVPATIDWLPPSAPSELSAKAKRKQIHLSWNAATDNVRVENYTVLRDGVKIGGTADTSYIDHSVTNGVTYTYVVLASDAVGNVSEPSNSATIGLIKGSGGGKGKKH